MNLLSKYLFQIVSAVQYCHQKCIVHRDLKVSDWFYNKNFLIINRYVILLELSFWLPNYARHCTRKLVLFFFKINLFILFIYFWLRWVFAAVRGLSLVAASRGYSSMRCAGFSLRWLLLLPRMGSRAQAQQLWHTGLAAPWHVRSSRTRDRTHVRCIGRQIPNHCATREAQEITFYLILTATFYRR